MSLIKRELVMTKEVSWENKFYNRDWVFSVNEYIFLKDFPKSEIVFVLAWF